MHYLTFLTKSKAEAAQNTIHTTYMSTLEGTGHSAYKTNTVRWCAPVRAKGQAFWIVPHPDEKRIPPETVTVIMKTLGKVTVKPSKASWFPAPARLL